MLPTSIESARFSSFPK